MNNPGGTALRARLSDSLADSLKLTRDRLPSEVPSDIVAQPAYEWLLPADGEG